MQVEKDVRQLRRQVKRQRRLGDEGGARLRSLPAANKTQGPRAHRQMEGDQRLGPRERDERACRARARNIQAHLGRRVLHTGHGPAALAARLDDLDGDAGAAAVRASQRGHVRHGAFPGRLDAQAGRHHQDKQPFEEQRVVGRRSSHHHRGCQDVAVSLCHSCRQRHAGYAACAAKVRTSAQVNTCSFKGRTT